MENTRKINTHVWFADFKYLNSTDPSKFSLDEFSSSFNSFVSSRESSILLVSEKLFSSLEDEEL